MNKQPVRQLKIKTEQIEKRFSDEHLEMKWVAMIAAEKAETQEEMDELYQVGMAVLDRAKEHLAAIQDGIERFGAWWVRQEILRYKLECKRQED